MNNNLTIENLMKTEWKNQFDREQLFQIKMGLEGNVDVSIYATPEYTRRQMYEIREGLEQGLDISKYAKPEIHAFDMENIRYKLYLKKERENKKMKKDLVLPVIEDGKLKYLKQK